MKGFNEPKGHQEIEAELKYAAGDIDWTIVPIKKILQIESMLNKLPTLG